MPAAQHNLCRPPRGAEKVTRLGGDGQWRDDNGRHATAFVGKLGGTWYIWVPHCSCKFVNGCPLGKALDFAAQHDATAVTTVERRRAYRSEPPPVKRRRKRKR